MSVGSTLSTTQPRWPRTRPPRTWKTWTAASSSSCGERDHVGVGAVAEHHGLLLHGPAQRADVVAQPGRPLELQVLRRLGHPPFQLAHHLVGAAGQEVAEVLDDVPVLLLGVTRPTHGAEHLSM